MTDKPLREVFLNVYAIALRKGISLRTVWANSGRQTQWNIKFRWTFKKGEINEFMQLSHVLENLARLQGRKDSRMWRWESSGKCSVKSTVRMLIQGGQRVPWHRQVWNMKFLIRIRIFFVEDSMGIEFQQQIGSEVSEGVSDRAVLFVDFTRKIRNIFVLLVELFEQFDIYFSRLLLWIGRNGL